jgi:hypothetical protein
MPGPNDPRRRLCRARYERSAERVYRLQLDSFLEASVRGLPVSIGPVRLLPPGAEDRCHFLVNPSKYSRDFDRSEAGTLLRFVNKVLW